MLSKIFHTYDLLNMAEGISKCMIKNLIKVTVLFSHPKWQSDFTVVDVILTDIMEHLRKLNE